VTYCSVIIDIRRNIAIRDDFVDEQTQVSRGSHPRCANNQGNPSPIALAMLPAMKIAMAPSFSSPS
jgi:hypothetical protein